MMRLRKGNALFLLFVILSAFLLMAADTPKTDVTVNIEGSNNDLTVELIEKAKQEGTTNLTKEELEELVRLQMKFLSGQESTGQGVDVKVETNTPAPTESTPTEKPQETSSPEPVETSDTDTSEQEQTQNQEQSEDGSEEEESEGGGFAIVVIFGLMILLVLGLGVLSDL